MRIAAIDCGSNSFHLLIADVGPHDRLVPIEDDKSLLYLGAEVATIGEISHSSLLRAKRVMRHYKVAIERHNVDHVVCVATSAIRTAKNGNDVIAALTKTLGHPVKVISGETEALTIFRAISAVSTLPETRVLACDMGGGSLELMAGQRHGLEHARSIPLGASRVSRELKIADPLSEKDKSEIRSKCSQYFSSFSKEYPASLFSHVVVSSGTLSAIVSMARAHADGYTSPPLSIISASAHEITDICEKLTTLSPKERKKIIGYDNTRDDFIATASIIAQEIAALVSPQATWSISPYALREGLAFTTFDELSSEDNSSVKEIAESTVSNLEKRMSAYSPSAQDHDDSSLVRHGRHVALLSQSLFDQTSRLHKLGPKDRELLGYAARLHDIGETITHSKHDQHGAYILSSIALVGFTPEDATVLRAIVRWHRMKDPRRNDRFVGRLSEEDFTRVEWLCSLLRIADGVESGKTQSVTALHVSIKPDVMYIRLVSESDCELEIYSARRKRTLLESISDKDVIIQQELAFE